MLLKLTTWQRIQLESVVGAQKGPVATVRKAIKLLDIVELTDAEKAAIGFKVNDLRFTWKDKDKTWDIDIQDKNLEMYLLQVCLAWEYWPINTEVLDLFEKLGVDENE